MEESIKPPQFSSNVTLNHTYRYSSANGGTYTISTNQLLMAAGAVCTTSNTTLSSFFQSVKVNSVKIWGPSQSLNAINTVSVEWISTTGTSTSSKEVSDTSMSTAFPAHVSSRPPRSSLASFWQLGNGPQLFTLRLSAGSIVDINLSLILQDDDTAVVTSPISTGSLTATYYLPLDHVAAGSGTLSPVSLTTTS